MFGRQVERAAAFKVKNINPAIVVQEDLKVVVKTYYRLQFGIGTLYDNHYWQYANTCVYNKCAVTIM